MATYSVNQAGVRQARALIDAHRYEIDSHWADAQPTTQDENDFIASDGWESYGAWHLGLKDQQDNPETKDHYGFAFGDFHKIYRQGLIAVIDRAGEWDHQAVEDAAHELLRHLDATRKLGGDPG